MIPKLLFIVFLYFSFAILVNCADPLEPLVLPHRSPEPYDERGADSSIKIIRPTFFIYIREPSSLDDERGMEEISHMVQVVNTARSKVYLYDSKHLDPWVENIVIIEEDDHWVVAFHPRGNKMVTRKAEGIYSFPFFMNRGYSPYYLSKNRLELIEKPEGSLTAVMPTISAFQIKYRLKVSTDYPDDNVDSYMSIDEAKRRNYEVWLEETGQLEEDKSQTDD